MNKRYLYIAAFSIPNDCTEWKNLFDTMTFHSITNEINGLRIDTTNPDNPQRGWTNTFKQLSTQKFNVKIKFNSGSIILERLFVSHNRYQKCIYLKYIFDVKPVSSINNNNKSYSITAEEDTVFLELKNTLSNSKCGLITVHPFLRQIHRWTLYSPI